MDSNESEFLFHGANKQLCEYKISPDDDDADKAGSATTTMIKHDSKNDSSIEKSLKASAQDMRHRIGNFRNYYILHLPSNRRQHMGAILD